MTPGKPLAVAAEGDRAVRITRGFDAPRDLVFAAHTKPELVKRWLTGPPGWTMPECHIDLRVGGKFRYVWRHEDGRTMAVGGTYHELVPPERIVHAELFDEDWTGGETLVTTVFAERNRRTEMTMTVLYASSKAREGALATGMTDGMEQSYAILDALLAASPN